MKKLLLQFDTDYYPASFDTVVGYDGGADHVLAYGGVTSENIKPLVEGAIFTRAPKDKQNTAVFIGGSNMAAGQALFIAAQAIFIPAYGFQVSIMLDSNGSNTTAAAGVARLAASGQLQHKKAVVLAGTGPVGQRVAVMLAQEGANVSLTSRDLGRAQRACQDMHDSFGVTLNPVLAFNSDDRGAAIADANIVFATGAAGIELLKPEHWQANSQINLMADANATPPIGIGGTDMMDKGEVRYAKIVWGAIGFGAFKLAVHRACIGRLFQDNKQVLDAQQIFQLAKTMT